MAFGCRIWLKSECDGCGMCDVQRHGYSRGARYDADVDEDDYDPFDADEEYEE